MMDRSSSARDVIERVQAACPLDVDVRICWHRDHDDDGFRKSVALNKAIAVHPAD